MTGSTVLNRRLIYLLASLTVLAAAVALATGASAMTDVTEDITTDAVWDSASGPYMIKADITVTGGSTLRILAGTEVKFTSDYSLLCDATSRIEANGLPGSPVVFTSGRGVPAMSDWETLNIGRGGSISNCSISYANIGLTLTDNARATDINFTFINTGVWISGTGAVLQNSEITGTTTSNGVVVENAVSATVRDCQIWNVAQGVNLLGTTSMSTVQRCIAIFTAEHGFGVSATGMGNRILDCTVDTTKRGIRVLDVPGQTVQGGLVVSGCFIKYCNEMGIEIFDVSPTTPNTIRRCTVRDSSKGILLQGSNKTQITESTVKDCNLGIQALDDPGYTNQIWNNNIINCPSPAISTNSQVKWNTTGPSARGNFWKHLTGEDLDEDGILDGKTYMMTGLQGDYFPLKDPVDYDPPMANAGPVKRPKQHKQFNFDGSASEDNTFIADWNWTVRLPTGDVFFNGVSASATIDVAGVFQVILTVTDAVGLTAQATTTVNVTDADAPALAEILTPQSVHNGEALNFSARITDNVATLQVWVMYRFGPLGQQKRLDLIDQGADLWGAEILVPVDLGDSIFYVLSARDAENNIARTADLAITIVDDILPVVVPLLPASVSTGDKAWLNCTATDNRGLGTVNLDYWFPGTEVTSKTMSGIGVSWSLLIDVPTNARSPLSVRFNVSDRTGNVLLMDPIDVPVVDNDLPVVNIDLTDRRFHYGMAGEFRLIVSDNVGVQEVFIDIRYAGGDWEPEPMAEDGSEWFAMVDIAVDRGHLLWYRFRPSDAAGNELQTPDVQVTLLSQNPIIVTPPPADAYEGTAYSFDVNASDPDNMDYELQWTMTTNASWLFIEPQTGVLSGTPDEGDVGIYWVNVSVSDGEGGSSFLTYTVTVHAVNSPPVVTIVSPEDGQKVGTVLRITGRAEDDEGLLTWVRCRIDDGEWVDLPGKSVWSYEQPAKEFTSGTHFFEVWAFDGVSESEVRSISFVVPEKENKDDGPGAGAVAAVIALAALAAIVARERRK